MWREQIDAFWDGKRAFVLGFFSGSRSRPGGPAGEIVVVSARDAGFLDQPSLVDIVDARRWRGGHCVLLLPRDHAHVLLRAADGAQLAFALTGPQTSHIGEIRLLSIESPGADGAPMACEIAALPARGDVERAVRDLIARSGDRLVWGLAQRRQIERLGGAPTLVHLWPARQVFPGGQSRIVIETTDSAADPAPAALRAPFAMMERWLRESGAPCATLRLRIPAQNEPMLSRVGAAIVLNQRRRLRQWTREQRFFGGATADPLTFEDIREAVGRPGERPEAVEAESAIVVHNLAALLAHPRSGDFDGLSLRRHVDNAGPQSGLTLDLEYFGAALGDDVGLVSAAATAGDFGVSPVDPGGAASARLFRVEADGLVPRRIDDNDPLLDEILRASAREERAATLFAPSADSASESLERRERLVAQFNALLSAAGYFGRFHARKLWDMFEPLAMANFTALAANASIEARAQLSRLGGWDAYLADPPLLEALMRGGDFARDGDEKSVAACAGASQSLVHRVAGAAQASNLVADDIDLATQIHIWRLLTQASNARRLTAAGIALTSADDISQAAFHAAETLLDEEAVERAATACDARGLPDGRALRDYLAGRRRGGWITLEDAARLAVVVEEAGAWRRNAEIAAAEPPPARKVGLLDRVRGVFARGVKGGRG